jgi:hypothetical protein
MRLMLIAALVAVTGCATAVLESTDPRRAVVLAPYMRPIGPFGQVHIPEGTILYAATVNGQQAWCSTVAVYFVPGERRPMCLFDPAGGDRAEGWLKSAHIPGTLASLRYDVDVPYRVGQTASLPARQ